MLINRGCFSIIISIKEEKRKCNEKQRYSPLINIKCSNVELFLCLKLSFILGASKKSVLAADMFR